MKTVILCGGKGTRLSEETALLPKPMVQIGGSPILWHIMNHFASFGFDSFTLALGYKGDVIKEYFLNYYQLNRNFEVNLGNGEVQYEGQQCQEWRVQLISTGLETLTGGRLLRLKSYLAPHGTFLLTYGDGLSDINIEELVKFHRQHGKAVTVTAVQPLGRFGSLDLDGDKVCHFQEKPMIGEGWINGGFFVMEPRVFDYLEDDETILERSPLERLAADGELMAYKHPGFWQCMDTLRDKQKLEEYWDSGRAPWVPNLK
jgi:glucose-1-phosphate cytidylyltransferase